MYTKYSGLSNDLDTGQAEEQARERFENPGSVCRKFQFISKTYVVANLDGVEHFKHGRLGFVFRCTTPAIVREFV